MNQQSITNQPTSRNYPTNRAERRACEAGRLGYAAPRSSGHQEGATDVIYMTVFIMGIPHVLPFSAGASPFSWVVSDTANAQEGWDLLVAQREVHRAALAADPHVTAGENLTDIRSPHPLHWMLDPVVDTERIPRMLQAFVGAEFAPHSVHLILTEDTPGQREELVAMLRVGAWRPLNLWLTSFAPRLCRPSPRSCAICQTS